MQPYDNNHRYPTSSLSPASPCEAVLIGLPASRGQAVCCRAIAFFCDRPRSGGGRIRTFGTPCGILRFSRPPPSAARPLLQLDKSSTYTASCPPSSVYLLLCAREPPEATPGTRDALCPWRPCGPGADGRCRRVVGDAEGRGTWNRHGRPRPSGSARQRRGAARGTEPAQSSARGWPSSSGREVRAAGGALSARERRRATVAERSFRPLGFGTGSSGMGTRRMRPPVLMESPLCCTAIQPFAKSISSQRSPRSSPAKKPALAAVATSVPSH